MNRWSTTASDNVAARPRTAALGGWARAHSQSAGGFAVPLERPATLPSAAKPDPRRTLNLETAPGRIELVIEALLVGLLLFMPAALGVVAPSSEMVVVCVAAAIAACLALKTLLHRRAEGRRIVWSWAYLPIALFVLLAVAQVVPLPASVVKSISPATVELKSRLLADAPSAAQDRMPLSFYPFAALRELRLVLVATVLFVAVVNTFHRTAQIKRLLGAVAAIGGIYGLIALLQDVTGADQIFWSIPTYGGARSGPFVNHNHYGQFINLAIGAAAGLLLVRLHEELPRRLSPAQVLDRIQDPEFRPLWWLAAMIVVGAVTLFVSLSRGGMMGMIVGTAFTALMLAVRRGLRGIGWGLSLIGLFVFIALLYVGFDAVAERVGTLHQANDPTSGRSQVYKDVAVSWRKFPVAGMGLGSWEVTYPMFDRSKTAAVAEYADSDYAQALHEIGAAGLAVVLLFAAVIWASYFRAIAPGRGALGAAAFGLGYGLLAVMVQSATDYGQHMPAIAGLTAVTCGLLVCLAKRAEAAKAAERERVNPASAITNLDTAGGAPAAVRGSGRKWVAFPAATGRLALPVVLLAGMAWALLSVNNARIADAYWQRSQSLASSLEADGWEGSNEDYTSLLMDTAAAAQRQPANVQYQYWLNAYRWRSISRVSDPDTGALILTEGSLAAAERITRELHAARPLGPTYGPLLCLAGQLEMLVLDRPRQGAEHVRLGRELSPNEPAAVFAAALVDVNEGKWDASLEKFRHCLTLNGNTINDVLAAYVGAGRPDLGLAASDGNAFWLLKLSLAMRGDDRHPDVRTQAQDKFLALMASEEQQSQATGWMLSEAGNLYRDRGDRATAISYYEKAVAKDYDRVDWRFELAKCLAAEGNTEAAMREARLCLRLRPQLTVAKKLIGQLGVRPSVGAGARPSPATQPEPATAPIPATVSQPATQPDLSTQPSAATKPEVSGEPAPAGQGDSGNDAVTE
jgi:tetratricopeptide (TPR) repeat protein